MRFCVKPKIYKNYDGDWDSSEQIIVCENGVFKRVRVNSLCYVTKKTSLKCLGLVEGEFEFDKVCDTPLSLEERPYMKRKIPRGIIETILKFYQVYAKYNTEVKLNVWYDKVEDNFFIDCPFQQNSACAVTEYTADHPDINWTASLINKYTQKHEMMKKIKSRQVEKILDTHSHHNMTISFSGQDDKVDYFDSVGYHLVGVYSSVLNYPVLHLRYFASPYKKGRPLTGATKSEDETTFSEVDIIDNSQIFCKKYDLNEFAKHVDIDTSILF